MYPNLYYVFKDWFGVEWKPLGFLNTFGFMVAMGFITAAIVLSSELRRKEKQALLLPREEFITVGKPASFFDLLLNFLIGFLFGFKLIGLVLDKSSTLNPQEYIFSGEGNIVTGLLAGLLLAGLKWWEKNKQRAKEPSQRSVRIWPHDRVGDIIVIGLIFGIIGAKLFDSFENWDDFVQHPWKRLFSAGGLTYYGGLILAGVAISIYAVKKNIRLVHLMDAVAPALLLAYAVGRIGCQVSGDGDWGIYNSAYITGPDGKAVKAKPGDFDAQLKKYDTYFLNGTVKEPGNPEPVPVTDRKSESLDKVPHKYLEAPAYLPTWMVAYSYPRNVNKDGIIIEGIQDEHNRALPVPVFPTPFYETIACTLLFLFLWSIRKRIRIAGLMTGIYLVLNGAERFLIEKIRVNNLMSFWGLKITQAELISFSLVITGVLVIVYVTVASGRKK